MSARKFSTKSKKNSSLKLSSNNKFFAKKTEVDGITFDSKKEAKRYAELKLLEKAKKISDLQHHYMFSFDLDGTHICKYEADFVYAVGFKTVVEDVKSAYTRKNPVYKIKQKLMKAFYDIDIVEIL